MAVLATSLHSCKATESPVLSPRIRSPKTFNRRRFLVAEIDRSQPCASCASAREDLITFGDRDVRTS